MMGSTEQSFIDNYLKHTPTISPYKELRAELDGMAKWHKIIGSTAPTYLHPPTLAIKIHRAQVARHAMICPWSRTVCQATPRQEVTA
jgi:hypothetical protein